MMSERSHQIESKCRELSRGAVSGAKTTVGCIYGAVKGTACGVVEGLGVSVQKPDIRIRKPRIPKIKFRRRHFVEPVIVSDGEYLGV
jgi:hypothetical protein